MTPEETKLITSPASRQKSKRSRLLIALVSCAAVLVGAVTVLTTLPWRSDRSAESVRYLGAFEPDAPHSYTNLDRFARAVGRQPNLVVYYSHWLTPFQVGFATAAAKHGAVTLVQLAPRETSVAAIAAGQFDSYLRSYADAVRKFEKPVILSFGHEMNGSWYTWGYRHTSPAVFVAAWRHIVDLFRAQKALNVTWLWTINIFTMANTNVSDPAPWWPGSTYVTMVGIDGYYYHSSQAFAQLFGSTIVDVRTLTRKPIIIAETSASPAAGQAAKITDLFTGVRAYGLLGFVWFDAIDPIKGLDWRLSGAAAITAYRQDAKAFIRPSTTSASTHDPSSRSLPQCLGRITRRVVGRSLTE
jgi:mannan endo-1,4-beta-mannosidase